MHVSGLYGNTTTNRQKLWKFISNSFWHHGHQTRISTSGTDMKANLKYLMKLDFLKQR